MSAMYDFDLLTRRDAGVSVDLIFVRHYKMKRVSLMSSEENQTARFHHSERLAFRESEYHENRYRLWVVYARERQAKASSSHVAVW